MPPGPQDEAALFGGLTSPKARELAMAGVECFAEKGFYGTTTRDIANRVDLSPAAVYVHFPSKAELLYTISAAGHEDALRALKGAAAAEEDPLRRIEAMVSAFAAWHARNHRLARVVQYELHALPEPRREEIGALRRRFREQFEAAIDAGTKAGLLVVPDPAGATLAILSLCIDIARWYSPTGPRSPQQLGDLFGGLMMQMLEGGTAPSEGS